EESDTVARDAACLHFLRHGEDARLRRQVVLNRAIPRRPAVGRRVPRTVASGPLLTPDTATGVLVRVDAREVDAGALRHRLPFSTLVSQTTTEGAPELPAVTNVRARARVRRGALPVRQPRVPHPL